MSKVSHSDCAVDYRMGLVELKPPCYKPKSRMILDVNNPQQLQLQNPRNNRRVLSPCTSPSCRMEKVVEMDMQEVCQSPTYSPRIKKQQVYPLQTLEETDLSQIPCYNYDSVNRDCGGSDRDFYSSGFERQMLDTDKYSLGYESGNYGSDMSKYTPEYEMSRFDLEHHQCVVSSCCSDNMSTSRSCEKLKLEQDTGFSEGLTSYSTSHSCEKLRPVDDRESHDCYMYNSMKVRKLHSNRRGVTPVGILWTLVSILVAGTCSFSFLQPFWFVQPETLDSFGMFSYCIQNHHLHRHHTRMMQACGIYGGEFHFSNLPSHSWQAACVLYGGGCAMQCLGALLAICSLCMPQTCYKKLSIASGYIQLMAVLIMIAGLIVFPLGLNSRFFQHYCGKSGMYNSGDCELGWGYLLGIMGTALSMFCPFLSQYTDMKVYDSYV